MGFNSGFKGLIFLQNKLGIRDHQAACVSVYPHF